jgi:hypothetical protein
VHLEKIKLFYLLLILLGSIFAIHTLTAAAVTAKPAHLDLIV